MKSFLEALTKRYEAGEISATQTYHAWCVVVEIFNNELEN